MIQRSHKTIIVADSSKLGRESFNNFSRLNSVDFLVTNHDADEDQLRAIRACGVDVVTA